MEENRAGWVKTHGRGVSAQTIQHDGVAELEREAPGVRLRHLDHSLFLGVQSELPLIQRVGLVQDLEDPPGNSRTEALAV
jgi:hypothetical protein